MESFWRSLASGSALSFFISPLTGLTALCSVHLGKREIPMKPLRRKKDYVVTRDPITGRDIILSLTEKEDILSDQGSVDSTGLHRKYFPSCGCDSEIGGRCSECGEFSCKSCHGHCCNCRKPLCLQHSYFLGEGNGEKIRLCNRCHDIITRRRRWAKLGHLFLSTFTEGGNDG